MRVSLLLLATVLVGCDGAEKSAAPTSPTAADGRQQPVPASEPKPEAAALRAGDAAKPQQDGDKEKIPIPQSKWNLAYAEKAWGLKLKSIKFEDKTPKFADQARKSHQYKLLLEFTKDLGGEELKAAQDVFNGTKQKMEFYLFDADNVVRDKKSVFQIEGEVTGVKGDAFWLRLALSFDTTEPALVRVEVREKK